MRKHMRKLFTAALMLACVAGCGQNEVSAPAGAPRGPAVDAASASPVAEVDYRRDVSDVSATAASTAEYPEDNTADVRLTVTNHGDKPATYEIVIGVYDASKAQVGAILVSTLASEYGPTQPGAVLKVSGAYGMDGGKLPKPFTVEVQSVDRVPAA